MKKKVLITASVYSHIRNFHLPYLKEFQKFGMEIHVGCAGIPDDAMYIDRRVELPFEKKVVSGSNFFAARILRKLIRAEGYDLVITHTSLAAFFTRLAVKGMKNRPKLINVVHGYLFNENTPLLKRWVLLNAERLTAPETDLLLVMNEWDYQVAMRYHLGKRIEKISGMGVDFSRLDCAKKEDGRQLRKSLGISESEFVLIYPAEFSKRKSQHVLIEGMRYLPQNVRLVLCGEGTQLPMCKALTKKLQLQDRILFPGQIINIAPWYCMSDALVASSLSEGLPFNVMEAMYLEVPVIASDVKGHTDLIKDGVNGLLYPHADASAYASQVRRLQESRLLKREIVKKARADVLQYSLQATLAAIMKLYLSL